MTERGSIAGVGGGRNGLHRRQIQRSRVVLDQALDRNGAFGRPLLLVLGKSEIFQRARNANGREQFRHFVDENVRQIVVGATGIAQPKHACNLREAVDASGSIELHHVRQQRSDAIAMGGVRGVSNRILDRMRGGCSRGSECAARGERAVPAEQMLPGQQELASWHGAPLMPQESCAQIPLSLQ